MKNIILYIALIIGCVTGCATGGHVEGDGIATGGQVELGDIDISPCVNLPGASTRECNKLENL
jgi:hypothetical protein